MAKKQHQRFTVAGFLPTQNPEQAHWMRELGKSNAAQPHVPSSQKGSRAARERQSIRDHQNDREV
ncbi:hypothetical protein [Cryobacterium zhongshanensis]|uniref:Uncharacterized protein n=1 Tax=Cryobacterium zhongshanensis TaxID=2928153 RepID=A0AA41QZF4_9MICO|nr:hypothetical protein [Cryobacterium zhongshanensis]MCI4659703.1 hypothetical protein [Cryobacterium zhongshanensis]